MIEHMKSKFLSHILLKFVVKTGYTSLIRFFLMSTYLSLSLPIEIPKVFYLELITFPPTLSIHRLGTGHYFSCISSSTYLLYSAAPLAVTFVLNLMYSGTTQISSNYS